MYDTMKKLIHLAKHLLRSSMVFFIVAPLYNFRRIYQIRFLCLFGLLFDPAMLKIRCLIMYTEKPPYRLESVSPTIWMETSKSCFDDVMEQVLSSMLLSIERIALQVRIFKRTPFPQF